MTRPNTRLARVGDELTHVLATHVTAALDHIDLELTLTDSLPDHTPGAGDIIALPYLEQRKCRTCDGRGWSAIDNQPAPCDDCDARGTVKLTPVERAALKRYELRSRREDIRDLLTAFEALRDSLRHECDAALRTRMPDTTTREKGTCHADPMLPGYYLPLADGGWFDPTCRRISRTVKPGLCDGCRKRLVRHNDLNGLKPPKDDRVVAFDSTVTMVDGVAKVRSVA